MLLKSHFSLCIYIQDHIKLQKDKLSRKVNSIIEIVPALKSFGKVSANFTTTGLFAGSRTGGQSLRSLPVQRPAVHFSSLVPNMIPKGGRQQNKRLLSCPSYIYRFKLNSQTRHDVTRLLKQSLKHSFLNLQTKNKIYAQ